MKQTAYSGENGPLVRAKWASRWKGLGGGAGMGLFSNLIYLHLQLPPSVHFFG